MDSLNRGNCITCSDTTIGADTMFYQDKDYIGYQHVQHFSPKLARFDKKIAFFIISAARHATQNKGYNYGKKYNREAMNNTVILLPINSKGNINFRFIDKFISELKNERVSKLNSRLKDAGLNDYTLTEEEKNVLKDADTWEWGVFNLKKLYGSSARGKRLKSEDRLPGKLPFVTAGEAETGISAFIANNIEVFPANTTTIDMFGSAKYRNYKYGADDHVAVVHTEKLPKHASIFVTSAIHKASHTGKFNYGNNFYASDADELYIKLPTKNGAPDYTSMKTYIRAIEKLVIKDVVEYADKNISQ